MGGAGVVTVNVVEPKAPAELVAIAFKTVAVKYDAVAIVTRPVDALIDTPAGTAVLSPCVMLHTTGTASVLDCVAVMRVYAAYDTSRIRDNGVMGFTTGRRGAKTLNVVGTNDEYPVFMFVAVTEKGVFGHTTPVDAVWAGTVNVMSPFVATCVIPLPLGNGDGVTVHAIGPVYAVLTCCATENVFRAVDVSSTWLARLPSVGRTAAPTSN